MATLDDLMGGPSRDEKIITLDDITGQFETKTQRQDYYQPKETEATSDLDASLIDPDREAAQSDFGGMWNLEEDEKPHTVSPERARRTGDRIARVIDTGFNFVASNFIAKDSGKDYKADERDLADLAEAWGDIAEEKQWEFSPMWQLVILYAIVYGPLCKEAFNDRKLMELETRQNEQEEKMKKMQDELDRIRQRAYDEARAEARRKAAETEKGADA